MGHRFWVPLQDFPMVLFVLMVAFAYGPTTVGPHGPLSSLLWGRRSVHGSPSIFPFVRNDYLGRRQHFIFVLFVRDAYE